MTVFIDHALECLLIQPQSVTVDCRLNIDSAELHKTGQNNTQHCKTKQDSAEKYRQCRTIQNNAKQYKTVQNHAKECKTKDNAKNKTVQNHTDSAQQYKTV